MKSVVKQYPNFFENLEEARRRLMNTCVLYDGVPKIIINICDYKPDKILRVFLAPMRLWGNTPGYLGTASGAEMDEHIESPDGKKSEILRKHINSPAFNKFRPFPLGMMNIDGHAAYVERSPTRTTEQGLTQRAIKSITLSALPPKTSGFKPEVAVRLGDPAFEACVTRDYPEVGESLRNLVSGEYDNTGVAFAPDWAFLKGLAGSAFLGYRHNLVGHVDPITRVLSLDKEYRHLVEAATELKFFSNVVAK